MKEKLTREEKIGIFLILWPIITVFIIFLIWDWQVILFGLGILGALTLAMVGMEMVERRH